MSKSEPFVKASSHRVGKVDTKHEKGGGQTAERVESVAPRFIQRTKEGERERSTSAEGAHLK